MIKKLYMSSCAVPVLLSDFSETWIFSKDFRTIADIPNFMKTRPMGTELFHADRQTNRRTDVTKLIATFRNFANANKNNFQVTSAKNEEHSHFTTHLALHYNTKPHFYTYKNSFFSVRLWKCKPKITHFFWRFADRASQYIYLSI